MSGARMYILSCESQIWIRSPGSPEVCACHSLSEYSDLLAAHGPSLTSGEGFDVVVMSDLLHFDQSHDVLIQSLTLLLCKNSSARAYVAAGKYTQPHVCDNFVREAFRAGIILEEGEVEPVWRGDLAILGGGLSLEQLGVRKNMCRWWVGHWALSH